VNNEEIIKKFIESAAKKRITEKDVCRDCGCTDEDCRQCIKAQGYPCSWAVRAGRKSLCTRCETEQK